MADEREVITKFVVEEQGLKGLRQSLEQSRAALRQMTADAKQFDLTGKKAADTIELFTRETIKLKREARVDNLGKQFGEMALQIGDADKAAKLLLADLIKIGATDEETRRALSAFNAGQRRGASSGAVQADDRFGEVSRDVGLFGDVETALRTVGASGAATEIFAIAEALPRLKVGLEGIPAQAKAAIDAIGTGNVGMIGVIAALGLTIKLFVDKAQADAARAKGVIDGILKTNELAATGTTASLSEIREQAQAQLDLAARNLLDANAIFNRLQEDVVKQYGAAGLALTAVNATLGTGAGEYKAANDALIEANKAYEEAATAVNAITVAMGDEQVARNDSAEAARKAAEAEDALAAARARSAARAFDMAVNATLEASNLAAGGNPEAVQDRIDALGRERAAILENLPLLQAQVDAAEKGSEAQRLLADSLSGYRERLQAIDVSLMTLATSGTLAVAQAAKEATDALKAQADIEKNLVAATERYNADVQRIEEQALAARASAQDKFNQALVAAAEAAASAAENALQKLQQRRDDLARNAGRGEVDAYKAAQLKRLDAEIQFQRDEAKAARAHARNLKQIREDAAASEEELLLRGDFAGLFSSRRQTTRDINRANQEYAAERAEQNLAFRQQLGDQIAQYQREREQRVVKFQRDLEDAQLQYQRERQQIDATRRAALVRASQQYQQELTLANQKYTAELKARRDAIARELQLVQQGEQAKAQIFQAVLNQARAILAAIAGAAGGSKGSGKSGPTLSRAFGGGLLPGQAAAVNDAYPGQRESYNGVTFPSGLGTFIPAVAGNVNPGQGGGGTQVNITQHITGGADANLIAEVSAKQIRQVFNGILRGNV